MKEPDVNKKQSFSFCVTGGSPQKFFSGCSLGKRGKDLQYFEYRSRKDFSAKIDGEPTKSVLDDSGFRFYLYEISLIRISRDVFCVGAQYAGVLKECLLAKEELKSSENSSSSFFVPDLTALKSSVSEGDNLDGTLAVASSRIDYFGDTGSLIEKVVFRGKDVFNSPKIDSILAAMAKGLSPTKAYSIHSVLIGVGLAGGVRFSADKFGNYRCSIAFTDEQIKILISFVKYMVELSVTVRICPLRRDSVDSE